MIVFVYTETAHAQVDGPFFSLVEAAASQLWEVPRSSVWIEGRTRGGFYYENVRWSSERGWLTSSRGVRPAQLIRPEAIEQAGSASV